MKTTHIIVKGRVQGVFFRDYTLKQAQQLNLTGWVRNLRDGSVEALLCGLEDNISSMLEWLGEGSPHSRVDNLQREDVESDEKHTTFEIRY
jgi:acylphosphatase